MESGHNNERPILRPSNHAEMMDYAKHAVDSTRTDDTGEVVEELADHLLLWMNHIREDEASLDAAMSYYRITITTRDGQIMAEMVAQADRVGYIGVNDIDKGDAWFDDAREVLADQAVGDFMARWNLRSHMKSAHRN